MSATVNGVKKSASLIVAPIALNSINVDLASVRVGDAVAITVTLNGPAPSAGFTVTLSSSNSSAIRPATDCQRAGRIDFGHG